MRSNDEPYYFHCARVAAWVSSFADSTEDMVVAAWLHDILEDTHMTMHSLYEQFGPTVGSYVVGLTNQYTKSSYPKLHREERKRLEFERLAQCSSEVRFIKLCDRLDNVCDIQNLKNKPYYVEETYDLVKEIGGTCAYLANEIYTKLEEVE
jgi:(p)ppGpp synthase/HD superfamily hydrolase